MSPKDRADQTEQRSPLRLPNKIADAKPNITSRLRCRVREEIEQHRHDDVLPRFFLHMATFTSLLPPHWESFPPELKMFLEKEMFDPVLLYILEREGLMNWCPSVRKVYPLITPGDGNCLLHAVSLAMWGIEDDELVLRTALFRLLRDDKNERNRLRWQRERMRVDSAIPGSGLVYNTIEWESEWDMIKTMASPERRLTTAQGLPYESLEQFHIFMLANMLRRPIIVVAQDMMRSQLGHSLQPQDLHGIYLPLNWDPATCYRHPILLGFHQNHFTPLLCTAKLDSEDDLDNHLFPIVQQDYTHMKVHFLEEEEEKHVDRLLQEYLIIEEITHIGRSLGSPHGIPGAQLASKNFNPDLDLMVPYLKLAETHYRLYLEREFGSTDESVETGGKSDVGMAKDPEKFYSLEDQPKSFPPVSYHAVPKEGKTSWSGAGAPVGQPSDAAGNAGSVSKPHPPFHRPFSLVEQSCKTEGCVYYRSVSTGEYCHECFQKRSQSQMCQGDRCLNPAEQGCQGLCRVCFDQRKLNEDAVVDATAPPLSKISLEPNANKAAPPAQVDESPYGFKKVGSTQNPLQAPLSQGSSSVGYAGMAVRRKEPMAEKACVNKGMANSPDDELNSLIVHQQVPSKKCIMPECPLTGDPSKNDMCGKCYTENLQVEQEVKKSKMGYQPAAAIKQPPAYSASQATTSATSSSAGALPGAAAASNEQLYPGRKLSKLTVQKNICATAGCEGIRLDTPPYSGYCFNCYSKNNRNPPLAPTVQARIPGTLLGQVQPNRQELPTPVIGVGRARLWENGNNYMTVSQPKQAESHLRGAVYPSVNTAPSAFEAGTKNHAPASGDLGRRCKHPRCNNLAAPPKFILCEECISVAAEQFKDEDRQQSVKQQAVRSGTLQPQPAEPSQPKVFSKASLSATEAGFKNIRINRVKCQVPGGCVDDMFGDPECGNLCSRCFAKMSMRRTRARASPPLCHAETRPTQSPVHQYHTAPLNPSPRIPQAPPRAQTEVMYSERQHDLPMVHKRHTLPANYQKCARPSCHNQANLQILEGYCNACHQVYRQHGYTPEPLLANSGSQARFYPQPPGCSTREEKILNIESGPRIPPRPEANRTDMGCLSEGCTNYGNPRCQGYCNSCFRLLKN
ncbi:tumor necrosis factor alpha-induced protein 3-like [Acanthaster planci]|uniref:ubiquitinyl hydrolase 1 n=1 Tax=Acanthaster planci TaxID=133434 RepID=A0A8B7XLX1_ACAPL|nr:tumor necrosis factor alpha-induced protein 3-like [Acanthaster planci]XP_022081814.1 tumor necrosis factor alpha-induced protein 3-like [Acanthaster planci]XP_022081816.1 tumor necrosis factor alpha-induced protein 3-like [Acanthaster planci]XP_022081817.1 tumor necrosis factor alpha-induced protein 3-like [Acanthaster planci]XP_022081818.1 tumor necrosis factor alpha-induced protein 3-like [Acanthaster planci]